jgi:hypothetical protein
MKNKTYKDFEDFLMDRCPCHTNNDPIGYERWLENLDAQELIDYADEYGNIRADEYKLAEDFGVVAGFDTKEVMGHFDNIIRGIKGK